LEKESSAPFELHSDTWLTTEKSAGSLRHGILEHRDHNLRRLDRFLGHSFGWSAEHLFTTVTPGGRTKVLPHQQILFRNSCLCIDVDDGKRVPKIFVNLPVTNVPRCVGPKLAASRRGFWQRT
jgi:hypothetical protein